MSDTLSIALLQTDIAWLDPERNRSLAEQAIASAAGADLLLLPETFTTGFGPGMTDMAEPPEGPTLQWARGMAARAGAVVVATWVVRTPQGCHNRLHWVFPDGSYGHYDKVHLFSRGGEADLFTPGTGRPIFELKGWRIRPAVCYDLRFPTFLRNKGAAYDLLLFCANWPVARIGAWDTLLRARAIENVCYVAACNRVGSDPKGTPYNGHSVVVDFRGNAVATAPDQASATRYTLSRPDLENFRQRWPFFNDFD